MQVLKQPLVIYHASCADGFGAAYAASLCLPDAEFFPMQYGYKTLPDMEGRNVCILDFSLSKPDMDHALLVSHKFLWLDHHKTAFEMWCGGIPESGVFIDSAENVKIVLDNGKSGALLAWEHFLPHSGVPLMIRLLDDYDRWQFKLEGTKEFNKAIWARTPWTFSQWSSRFEGNTEQLIAEGAALQRAHDANIRSVLRGGKMAGRILVTAPKIGGEHWEADFIVDAKGLACNCPAHLSSDAGHELAIESGTFGLLWRIDKEGKCLCSLRSNGAYDVSALAKKLGGGGHLNAAGFETKIETLLTWLKP